MPLEPAFALVHEWPAVSWTLAELARRCAMSRTSFAARFRAVVGLPPRAYLIRRRMLLAQRDLARNDARIGELGRRLRYSSEAAFSSTFTREVGVVPSSYRSAARTRASAPAAERSAPKVRTVKGSQASSTAIP